MTRSRGLLLATVVSVSLGAFAQSEQELFVLPALTPVPLVIDAEISSSTNRSGDRFPLHVAEDVKLGDSVLIPAGSVGEGEVVHAAKSKGGGRAGELILAARFVTVDGQQVRLRSFAAGSGKDRSNASLGVGIAVGLFGMLVRGDDLVMPAGTLVSAKTAAETQLRAAAKAAKNVNRISGDPILSSTPEEPVSE
jgi:hypothetical protein